MIRVGLLGLGMMGRHHARVLRNVDGLQLVAVADSNGDKFGVARDLPLVATIDELLTYGLDLAVIAVPTSLHRPAAEQFLLAGVNVLVEKPVADTSLNAQSMALLVDAQHLIGAVGHIERYNSALIELGRRLKLGEVGEIFQISTSRQGGFPPRISDVGVAQDLATHDIDLTSWLAQSPYKSVSAQSTRKAGRDLDDLIAITGRLQNGVIVNHLVNWLSPRKERTVTITGSRGTFVADLLSSDLTFHENGANNSDWEALSTFRGMSEGNTTIFSFPKREPLQSELEAVRDAILGVNKNIVTFNEGHRTLKTVEACMESAEKNEIVHLI